MVRGILAAGCLSLGGWLLAQEAYPPDLKPRPAAEPAKIVPQKPSAKPAAKANTAEQDDEEQAGATANGPAPNGTAAAPLRTTVLRPEMTREQRTEWATRLRSVYSLSAERWPVPSVDRDVKWQELALLPEAKHPEHNPGIPEKIELGKILFFDPRLSGSGQMACANCHDPDLNWADGRTTAIGNNRRVLKRNAPTLMNVGLHNKLFWDGRAESLEDQAKQVLANSDEMDSSDELIIERLGKIPAYREHFKKSFDTEEITVDRVVAAIAAFERTLIGGFSRFDSFLRGKHEVLSDEAVIGLHLFRTEARCMNCHHGSNFTDNQFHEVGLSYYGRKFEDLGRYKITNDAADVGRFKTPTLRNVANTGPYMHNGLFPLDGVLNMYNAGMPTIRRRAEWAEDKLFPTKSPHLVRLNLNRQDLGALKAFLEALSEPPRRIRPPELPGMAEAALPKRALVKPVMNDAEATTKE
jgi:cytochrome c peroxidase